MVATKFPRCKLHGTRIVDDLPAGCPLQSDRALVLVGAIEDAAYRELGRLDGDLSGALALFERAEICEGCVCRLRRFSKRIQAA